MGAWGTHPRRIVAPSAAAADRASRIAKSTLERISRASSANTRPAAVSDTDRLVRSSNRTPSSLSSRRMARESGGWAMWRRLAARP